MCQLSCETLGRALMHQTVELWKVMTNGQLFPADSPTSDEGRLGLHPPHFPPVSRKGAEVGRSVVKGRWRSRGWGRRFWRGRQCQWWWWDWGEHCWGWPRKSSTWVVRWGYEIWEGLVMKYLMHGAGESNIDPWWGISRIKDLHWVIGWSWLFLFKCL